MNKTGSIGGYEVVPFPPERNATLDTLRWAKKRLLIPTLLEVDITAVRKAIRTYRAQAGRGLSLTAWVVACVARAAAEHPRVHGLRKGKRGIVLFEEVDVAVLVEREIGGDGGKETLPMPMVIRSAHTKRPSDIHEEIHGAQEARLAEGSASLEPTVSPWLQSVFFRLPGWVRDLAFWRWLLRSPTRAKRTMGTVVVTSIGMAVPGILAWGIPLSLHPLAVGVGGVTRRKAGDQSTEVLALTVVFDHAVTDGAPVGRFIKRLHELLTRGEGVEAMESGRMPPVTPALPCEPWPGRTPRVPERPGR